MPWDPIWDDVFLSRPWGKYPGEEVIRFVARNYYGAADRSAIKIMEVGCGPGANLVYLATEGFSFIGVDGSRVAIEKARARLDAELPDWQQRGQLRVCDIHSLPLEDSSVDAVIDNECVYANSLGNSAKIYREVWRVLRPHGRVFVRAFTDGSWGDKTGTRLEDGTWICGEGPALGMGPSRFTKEAEIPMLLSGFTISSREVVSRTHENMRQQVREWIIYAEKDL
jgi:SAM-dependent methyltransferase